MNPTMVSTDSRIKEEVLRELRWDPRVDETAVGVQVEDGVVTLTGVVPSYPAKLAAQDAAHRVRGVLDVANDVDVRPVGSRERTDADLARAARHALEWDVLVPHEAIHCTVSHGWITLEGIVSSLAERRDAVRAVQRLTGVVGVTDHLAVETPAADPEEVRHAIRQALGRQAHREANHLDLLVREGVLTVRGRVHSWPERRAVLNVASCAPGVRAVEDQLLVDPHG